MKRLQLVLGGLGFWVCGMLSVAAQDITLSSQDGSISVSGELLNYDGHFYRVQTEFGPLTVDGSRVSCDGPACPNLFEFTPEIRIASQDRAVTDLLGAALREFAHSLMAELRVELYEPKGEQHFLILNTQTNRLEARFILKEQPLSDSVEDLLTYDIDLIYGFEALSEDQLDRIADADLGHLSQAPWRSVIARDSWVPVSHPLGPIGEISLRDMHAILRGEAQDWSDIGDSEGPITLYKPRPQTALSRQLTASLRTKLPADATNYQTEAEALAALAQNPFGIAFVRLSHRQDMPMLDISGQCGRGFRISRDTVKAGIYPFSTPLLAYRPARSLPNYATAFIDFMRGPKGQTLVRDLGLIDQSVELIPITDQGDRLLNTLQTLTPETAADVATLANTLAGKRRLSLVFRFNAGSSDLSRRSRDDLASLIRLLQTGALDGQHLHFLGFSDSLGAYEANVALSQQRADATMGDVLAQLTPADIAKINMSAQGFGPLMPIVCDDTEEERDINRRVEIWVSDITNTPPSEN